MADRKHPLELRPIAAIALVLLAVLVLFSSPKRQVAIEYGGEQPVSGAAN